tara:strand:- start:290 stop:733 length:444 start_codon:yes stop_codon:yes gene_type:complete
MKIFNIFKKKKSESLVKESIKFDFELTAAVLAYEIARIDGDIDKDELNILMDKIIVISNKTNKEESAILEMIETFSKNSVSFYDFIEDINKEYTKEEKTNLLSYLWKIAYADNRLDIQEERLIRRIADLTGIKDMEVLKLKDETRSK